MNRTMFFGDRLSFILGVRLCETDGAPKNSEDVAKYYDEVKNMREVISQANSN